MHKIVEDHWKYVEALTRATLPAAGNTTVAFTIDELVALIGFHYKSAFIHGWKHALEASQAEDTALPSCSDDASVEKIIKNALMGKSPTEEELTRVLTFLREDR